MPASDTDYLSAVKQGDTAKAQEMANEAAKAAGYKTKVGGFFVKNANESIGKLPAWADEIYKFGKLASENGRFETVKEYHRAASYGDAIDPKRGSVTESALRYWDGSDGTLANYIFEQGLKGKEIGPFVFAERIGNAPERGYSLNYRDQTGERGVSVLGLLDPSKGLVKQNDGTFELFNDGERKFVGGFLTPFKGSDGEPLLIGIQFDGKRHQIKSADPITKDDSGNVIPLSQRFKATSEDIRYMPGEATIYRAGDKTETGVKAFSSWSENKSTAEAYLDNPGFGGAVLRSEKVPLNSVLDADTTNRKGMERLARQLGFDAGTGDEWFDNGWKYPWEESKSVKEALKKSGFDAIRYPDDFPEGATSIVPLKDFAGSENNRFMPSPDSAMPGAYSFPGGYRALPGKAKGSLRLYGPAGSLIGIASSLDEAQRILRRKNK